MAEQNLSNEQLIVRSLANMKIITQVGEVQKALLDEKYAESLFGGIDADGEQYEALTNEEVQEVFDNDVEQNEENNENK